VSRQKKLFFSIKGNNIKDILIKQIVNNYNKKYIVNNIIKNVVIYLDLIYTLYHDNNAMVEDPDYL